MKKITCETAERFETNTKNGLSAEQVQSRVEQGLTNKTKPAFGKSYFEIVFTNVLNFFNILLFLIAGFMIFAGYYNSIAFLGILIPNILIGLYQDIKARVTLSKLRLITQPKAIVVRDGNQETIDIQDVVLDDILSFTGDLQICVDGNVVEGSILVNESLLTGESLNIEKRVGDTVYSGSYVVSGNAFVRANTIGRERYAEKLQSAANKFRRSPSQILRSLRALFRIIGGVVMACAAAAIAIYAIQGKFNDVESFKKAIGPFSGFLVAMIPTGLYLLTSVTLATTVMSLAKKNAQVQDFYSVEMLARTNVLCVDKTGTITDGSMSVKKVMPLISGMPIVDIEQTISNLLHATKDENLTTKGMRSYFKYEATRVAEHVIKFNSDNKYSAATFKGGDTYVMGALEFIPIVNKEGIMKRAEEYTSYGFRILVLAHTKKPITNHTLEGPLVPIAFIIMQDNVRPNVVDTFDWFKQNSVEIKVISGDDAQTVSETARQAGVQGYEKFISLAHMTNEEVAAAALEYNVFGRVTPEQKEIIIKSLKEAGKTVAMTGDGVNDILALKRADCSIAMASGSDAARNVSHIVLMNSDFNTLPSVVAEGRRVINNLQRTSTLFLTKTFFALFFTVFFFIMPIVVQDNSIVYPFSTNNLYLWEFLGIAVAGFLLALEPNAEPLRGKFLKNIFSRALPSSLIIICPVLTIFVLCYLQKTGQAFTGVYPDLTADGLDYLNTSETAIAMSVITFTLSTIVVLYRICYPFSKYRKIVFFSTSGLIVFGLSLFGLITYLTGWKSITDGSLSGLRNINFLHINYLSLSALNYFEIAVIVVVYGAIFIVASTLNDIFKKKGKNNDDNH